MRDIAKATESCHATSNRASDEQPINRGSKALIPTLTRTCISKRLHRRVLHIPHTANHLNIRIATDRHYSYLQNGTGPSQGHASSGMAHRTAKGGSAGFKICLCSDLLNQRGVRLEKSMGGSTSMRGWSIPVILAVIEAPIILSLVL